jgi:hypothetical protein
MRKQRKTDFLREKVGTAKYKRKFTAKNNIKTDVLGKNVDQAICWDFFRQKMLIPIILNIDKQNYSKTGKSPVNNQT